MMFIGGIAVGVGAVRVAGSLAVRATGFSAFFVVG